PPGAVPTASDYLVVGPGRPDTPSTTSLTASQLAALPVGCEYRSTDGASVGAWRWQRVLTDTLCSRDGWLCTVGDTGFRDVAPLSPYYDRMKTGGSWDRVLILRRVGSSITLDYGFRTSTSEYEPIIWTFTPGWRVFARGEPYSYASSGQSFTPLRLSGDELRVAPGATRDGGAYMGVFSGQSRDPWPVALPGTPHNT
ncbi:hypothetical protein ACTQ43_14155, partial [Segatella copri]|uniref:hypothetical protein n=1 Tax=Segatella copri TaxID=165179 RepID=UPI003F993407